MLVVVGCLASQRTSAPGAVARCLAQVDDEDLWDDEEEQPQSSRIKLHGGPGLAPLPGGTAAAMQPQLAAGGGGA